MTCEQLKPALVAYHFGTVGPRERDDIEEHLLACPSCCRAFLRLKREIETSPDGPRPSAAARLRLRDAVAAHVRDRRRSPRWWEAPFALGFAGVAVAAALFTMRVLTSGEGSMPHGLRGDAASTAPPR